MLRLLMVDFADPSIRARFNDSVFLASHTLRVSGLAHPREPLESQPWHRGPGAGEVPPVLALLLGNPFGTSVERRSDRDGRPDGPGGLETVRRDVRETLLRREPERTRRCQIKTGNRQWPSRGEERRGSERRRPRRSAGYGRSEEDGRNERTSRLVGLQGRVDVGGAIRNYCGTIDKRRLRGCTT